MYFSSLWDFLKIGRLLAEELGDGFDLLLVRLR
jgi:hypothetical protein